MSSKQSYETYVTLMRRIADIKNALAVLQWDQETYLPSKGAGFRSQQIASLSELAHEMFTAPVSGDIIKELLQSDQLNADQMKNVTLSHEDYVKQKKLSAGFVRTLSEAVSKSFHAWIYARKANSFALFEKELDALVLLKRQEADLLGYSAHPYDALLDEFEKGCTVALLDRCFLEVRGPLKDLLDRIETKKQVDHSFLQQHFDRQKQWEFGMAIIKESGFDFEAGRQDISEHPFTTSFNCHDVRITTRIDENDFGSMTWSCIHEMGHALYEQGLPAEQYGLPLGEYASLSIHESQSRLWENHVGRAQPFWENHFPKLQVLFARQFGGISLNQFYQAINAVKPSLVRTEADELTYHFHVMIRYELEKRLLSGELSARDIPGYWNEQYYNYLGIRVPDDKSGCLQDVHWSHGSFGYFPTYSLGSFYAAQFFARASQEIEGLSGFIAGGSTQPLLDWLRIHIYRYGRKFTSEELCLQASGEVLNVQHFLRYLLDKYAKIYDF